MTEKQQLIKARLALLNLAAEVKNVSRACKLAGVSRSQFYAMKKAYETYGQDGLAPRVRRKPNMPNRTPAFIEEDILRSTRGNPTFSYVRLAGFMKSKGINVTATMVRYVWQRHGLSIRSVRLVWANQVSGNAVGSSVTQPQYEMRTTSLTAPVSGDIPSSIKKASAGRKTSAGNGSQVDWGYWGRVVRESLTK